MLWAQGRSGGWEWGEDEGKRVILGPATFIEADEGVTHYCWHPDEGQRAAIRAMQERGAEELARRVKTLPPDEETDKLVFDAMLCTTHMTSRREDEITHQRWRWLCPDVRVWLREALARGVSREKFYESAQRLINCGLVVGNPFGHGGWFICGGVKPAGQRVIDNHLKHKQAKERANQ
jgi:hypothetical protein